MPYPLIDFSAVEHIFTPLTDLHVGRVEIIENAEDELICIAVRHLLDHYAIEGWLLDTNELACGNDPKQPVQVFLVYGGTNPTGMLNALPKTLRQISAGRSIVYMPGTAEQVTPHAPNETLYSSDAACVDRYAQAEPAPDPCLTLTEFFQLEPVSQPLGVFLQAGSPHDAAAFSLGDPLTLCPNAYFYTALASNFAHLITDRWRFALTGLFAGRDVTLLPDHSGVNRNIYDRWLREQGCQWQEHLDRVDYDPRKVQRKLLRWFVAGNKNHVKRSAVPRRVSGCDVRPLHDAAVISTTDGQRFPCSYSVYLIWALCDGERTVLDIIATVADQVAGAIPVLASDVDTGLQFLLGLNTIELVWPSPALTGPVTMVPYQDAPVVIDVQPRSRDTGITRLSAALTDPVRGPATLWYEVPTDWEHALTQRADPFGLAALYIAMIHKRRLLVRGAPVSQSLLWNLDEFQRAWCSRYGQYARVAIDAETCPDQFDPELPAISCYSGGVDSSFTLLQHLTGNDGHPRRLGAAVLALGLDIPAQDRQGFAPLAAMAARLLEEKGLPLITVRTNIRATCEHYQYFHAPHIASCLTLFSNGFSSGLIPSSFTYRGALIEGSNPITDHLLGSRSFAIHHDGAAYNRLQKVERLLQWPDAADHIRVCWRLPQRQENCGRCWKCLQTAMLFRACGGDPMSLQHVRDQDIDDHVQQLWLRGPSLFESVIDAAGRYGVDRPWLEILRARLAATKNH